MKTVHITAPSLSLAAYVPMWEEREYRVRFRNDTEAEEDVRLYRPEMHSLYTSLTPVQKSDVWRYVVLWEHGGVYADADVVPLVPVDAENVLVVESNPLFSLLPTSDVLCSLPFVDFVRLPQIRNCVMALSRQHPILEDVLARILTYGSNSRSLPPSEPQRTLEFTGPGVLTDAARSRSLSLSRSRSAEDDLVLLSRWEGMRHFRHLGVGSWKESSVAGPCLGILGLILVLWQKRRSSTGKLHTFPTLRALSSQRWSRAIGLVGGGDPRTK